jgi:hypothetical protein
MIAIGDDVESSHVTTKRGALRKIATLFPQKFDLILIDGVTRLCAPSLETWTADISHWLA